MAEPEVVEEGQGDTVAGLLERLAELHRNGALTDKEFSAAKAELLRRPGSDR